MDMIKDVHMQNSAASNPVSLEKEKLIQACANAIQGKKVAQAKNFCDQILKKEKNRAFVSGEKAYNPEDVSELVRRAYNANPANFDTVLNFIKDTFPYFDQRRVAYNTLWNERVNVKLVRTNVKLEEQVPESTTTKNNVNAPVILPGRKQIEKEKIIQDCVNAIQAGNLNEAEQQWRQLLQGENGFYNRDWHRYSYVKKIVHLAYAGNPNYFNNMLQFVNKLHYSDQRVEAYQTLFESLQQTDEATLKELNNNVKKLRGAYLSGEYKNKFKALNVTLENTIQFYRGGLHQAAKTFHYLSNNIIQANGINILISTYYNLPAHLSSYPFQDELNRALKEAKEVITQYKDFVLPNGWMSHEADPPQLNLWVFDEYQAISKSGGTVAFFQSFRKARWVAIDGIYVYREKYNGHIDGFKHEFMHALIAGGIRNANFLESLPRWFNDGFAELAEHGPCSNTQLSSLKRHINREISYLGLTYEDALNEFFAMIRLSSTQQKEKYSNNWLLNYLYAYFNVLYLRVRHPLFLQQILHETYELGWEGSDNSLTPRVKERLCNLLDREKDIFNNWMKSSTRDRSLCFTGQPNSKFKLSHSRDSSITFSLLRPSSSENVFNENKLVDEDALADYATSVHAVNKKPNVWNKLANYLLPVLSIGGFIGFIGGYLGYRNRLRGTYSPVRPNLAVPTVPLLTMANKVNAEPVMPTVKNQAAINGNRTTVTTPLNTFSFSCSCATETVAAYTTIKWLGLFGNGSFVNALNKIEKLNQESTVSLLDETEMTIKRLQTSQTYPSF